MEKTIEYSRGVICLMGVVLRLLQWPGALILAVLSISTPDPLAAADPVISVTPGTVSCADSLVVEGEGFIPDSRVIISTGTADDIPETVFEGYWGPVTVADDGSFLIEGIKPTLSECIGLSPEPHFLTASTTTGDSLDGAFGAPTATSSFAVVPEPDDPHLMLSPDRGAGCLNVTAQGENFEPGTFVTLFTNEFPGNHTIASLGEALVAENGTFSFDLPGRVTPFITCEDGRLPRNGQHYLVWASTGQSKVGEGLREPSAGRVFTVVLGSAEHFQAVWAGTDLPVDEGVVGRTWIWGPAVTDVMTEPYAESPEDQRAVQYFDKSRMEITDPNADPDSSWYVTNGLLVVELITGEMQVGDDELVPRFPSETPVAGDNIPRNGPSYATFQRLREPVDDRGDSVIVDRLDWEGAVTGDPALEDQEVLIAHYDEVTGHNIAGPFWEFMNSSGTIWGNGQFTDGPLFPNPFYATGRPITEPYWSDVAVAGIEQLVLVQCFERRCLTYTPDNPTGWQVEAGNVGRHYYQWRYGESTATGTILFERDGDLYTVNADGTGERNLTADFDRAALKPEWSPDGARIVFIGASDPFVEAGSIHVMNADGSDLQRLTDGYPDAAPSWSPDGARIAFERWLNGEPPDRFGIAQIFTMNADGTNELQVTDIPPEESFSASQSPAWSSDGEYVAFSNINGMPGPIPSDSAIYIVRPDGSNLARLAESKGDGQPIWSPAGDTIVYERQPGGSSDFEGRTLWLVGLDDSEPVALAGGERADPDEPAWSPSGESLIYWRHAERYSEELELVRFDLSTMATTKIAHFGRGPDWSPDGQSLAVVVDGGIVVMNPDGTESVLIHNAGSSPQWQPGL